MARATKKTVPAKAAPKVKVKARAPKRTQAERKAKAIELLLYAVAGGWTVERFAKVSGVHRATLFRWLSEDTIQPRFLRAMQIKALALPDEAMGLVKLLRRGGEFIAVPDPDKPGEFKQQWRPVDPKAIGVALRHIEFRMMREIKAQYQPSRETTIKTSVADMTDAEIEAKYAELMARASGSPAP